MKHILRHFFLPHRSNNHRPKLLHSDSILIIAVLFFVATFVLSFVQTSYPQVLGTTINISAQELVVLTNKERQKAGIPPLTYNDKLALAADNKAKDMFANNYWAHISPNGKTPWVLIQSAGYNYTYAGENLARGFTDPDSAMTAWMNSPTHRANILSPNYQDVGFAIEEGTLTGEKDTVLIVEEFGGNTLAPLAKSNGSLPVTTVLAEGTNNTLQSPGITATPLIDRFSFGKNITQLLLMLFIVIFILDLIIIERKQISRLVGHNLDHVFFLAAVLRFILLMGKQGIIF